MDNKVSCGSIYEAKHKKVKSFRIPKYKKVKSFSNTEVYFDFGTQAGIDADAGGTMQYAGTKF